MTKQIGDMYLAAALLAYESELKAIDKSNKKRQMFGFNDSIPYVYILEAGIPLRVSQPTIDDVETYFIAKKLMFPPSYPDAIRRIKSSIHSDDN